MMNIKEPGKKHLEILPVLSGILVDSHLISFGVNSVWPPSFYAANYIESISANKDNTASRPCPVTEENKISSCPWGKCIVV